MERLGFDSVAETGKDMSIRYIFSTDMSLLVRLGCHSVAETMVKAGRSGVLSQQM